MSQAFAHIVNHIIYDGIKNKITFILQIYIEISSNSSKGMWFF